MSGHSERRPRAASESDRDSHAAGSSSASEHSEDGTSAAHDSRKRPRMDAHRFHHEDGGQVPSSSTLPATDRNEQSEEGSKDVKTKLLEQHRVTPAGAVAQHAVDVAPRRHVDDSDDNDNDAAAATSRIEKYYPAFQGCRSVDEYTRLNQIEEGSYGVVFRARDVRSGRIYALKRLKMEKEKDGFPITSLREIDTLLKSPHPNIVLVREIVVGSSMDHIFLVMEFVEHDLKTLMESMRQPFSGGEVKTLMLHLLAGVNHLHDNWIIHRDLKTSNLLLSNQGVLKLADFGLAREYGSPLHAMTALVVTLWYRSPELLLGETKYTTAVDMWSVGCIFAELLIHEPLFPGQRELQQLRMISDMLGPPSKEIWPGYENLPNAQVLSFSKDQPYNRLPTKIPGLSAQGLKLLNGLLTYDPKKRMTAEQALRHPYFSESPLPVDPSVFRSWPAKSELQKVHTSHDEPRAPEGHPSEVAADGDAAGFIFESDDVYRLLQHGSNAQVGGGFKLKF
ncbi:hypothetical protein CAOG_08444 [Capsaspora owczarzaki ATCC 30864]|uniref:cyclin-dependent kinase n=1 Tax=Capsaspora owczarzaki (strain ATCC 30864) TaxID=595528 RepID=A0A0D2VHA9_CAPO3|nr:hypothetical protein CAOG_08444 [Capsaspora owczarzaki ATCC 30864]KJE89337.1 CMGC/CDK protein kinase [Capsaspora owczarzaki ATCC 30864]|eukprot:XP_011270016.1 hypothetical protein CAOG_08444 [Capsaspora owczarzaki ATCC 30864]